jgi:lipoprotein-anchoring transpeptidase ErfK/SrfK
VPRRCLTGAAWAATATRAYAAIVPTSATAYARPGGAVVARFARFDDDRFPTVFAVLGARVGRSCSPTWYHVQLSVVPNGTTAWVPAGSVRVYAVGARVVVDLSARRLVAYRGGRPVLRARVAVGSPATPTPIGRFFVDESFRLADPSGPYGVAALGISAHSTVLHDWAQGGPIALHGTNEPGSIGEAVSHGCVRLANGDMRRLLALAPAGTPVVVRR